MNTFENLLINYFGCATPVFDTNTGGLTASGKKAYRQLKDLISELDSIKVLSKIDVINSLDKITETHVLVSQLNSLNPELEHLRKAVVGRSLFTYDSWNGSSMTITVEGVEILDKSIHFTGPNCWGNRSGIYVDKDSLEELIATGEATKYNTIERCNVQINWKLK